jgi:hypothetical protein
MIATIHDRPPPGSAAVSPVSLPADPELSPDVGGSIVSAVISNDR